jgi:vanillate O-demethylase monooxygenase subunit
MNAVTNFPDAAPAYLRNAWYATAWSKDLADAPMAKVMLEEEILLYRKADGTVVALGNRCPHRFVELHRGKVVGDNIQCPYHGLQFNPAGACAHNPHAKNLPAAAKVISYPAEERHRMIWLWMGDHDKADPALIPDFSILCDPEHAVVGGIFEIAADYQLYSDNLLDLSHTEFVHPTLLEQGNLARSVAKVRQDGDTVHFVRDSEKEPASGTFQRMLCEGMGGKAGDIVHTRHHIRWNAPANLLAEITQFRDDKQSVFTNIHIAAPTSRGKCQLLWSATRNFRLNDPELDDYIVTGMAHVLADEDIPPVESQSSYIGSQDLLEMKPVLLPTDEAPIRARRILSRMIKEERGQVVAETTEPF